MTVSAKMKSTSVKAGSVSKTGSRHKKGGADKSLLVSSFGFRDLDDFVAEVHTATPIKMVKIERSGIPGKVLTDLSVRMGVSFKRTWEVLGIPPATGSRKKAASDTTVNGQAGIAAIGVVKLIGIAQEMLDNSTSDQAKEFDVVKWFGEWIERPQAALGGGKPAEYLDTPAGIEMVGNLLGSIQSGAYL